MTYEGILQTKSANLICNRCELSKLCQNVIAGVGDERAKYMFVLEQPSGYDDYKGELLAGREGRLFEKMLGMAGVKQHEAYVTYAVKCYSFKREGKARKETAPKAHNIKACKHWLWEEIQHIQPEAIFLMGKLSARSLLNLPTKSPLKDIVGLPISVSYTKAPVVPLFALSYLLYINDYHLARTAKIIRKTINEHATRTS